jgi:hypothetical protein
MTPDEVATYNAGIASEIKARFASEPVDGEWSLGMTREIRLTLGTPAGGTALEEAQCASSLCRVVLAHQSAAAQRDIIAFVKPLEKLQTAIFFDYTTEPNHWETTLYVLREGHRFPDPPRKL